MGPQTREIWSFRGQLDDPCERDSRNKLAVDEDSEFDRSSQLRHVKTTSISRENEWIANLEYRETRAYNHRKLTFCRDVTAQGLVLLIEATC